MKNIITSPVSSVCMPSNGNAFFNDELGNTPQTGYMIFQHVLITLDPEGDRYKDRAKKAIIRAKEIMNKQPVNNVYIGIYRTYGGMVTVGTFERYDSLKIALTLNADRAFDLYWDVKDQEMMKTINDVPNAIGAYK